MEKNTDSFLEQASPLAGLLIGDVLQIDIKTLAGRIAARAFAYALEAEGRSKTADALLDLVGMEG